MKYISTQQSSFLVIEKKYHIFEFPPITFSMGAAIVYLHYMIHMYCVSHMTQHLLTTIKPVLNFPKLIN